MFKILFIGHRNKNQKYEFVPERGELKGTRTVSRIYDTTFVCSVRLTDRSFLVLGGGESASYNAIEHNILDDSVEEHPMMANKREHGGCALFEDKNETWVISAGGMHSFETTEVYSVSTRTWQSAANLNFPRRGFVITHITAGIFAIGGNSPEDEDIHKVEQFIVSNWTWQVIPIQIPSGFRSGGLAEVPAELFNLN